MDYFFVVKNVEDHTDVFVAKTKSSLAVGSCVDGESVEGGGENYLVVCRIKGMGSSAFCKMVYAMDECGLAADNAPCFSRVLASIIIQTMHQ